MMSPDAKLADFRVRCKKIPSYIDHFTLGKEYPVRVGGPEDKNRWYIKCDSESTVFINGDDDDAKEFFKAYFEVVDPAEEAYERAMSIL